MSNIPISDTRIELYLGTTKVPKYANTIDENEIVSLWNAKYLIAKSEYEKSRLKPENLQLWRDAYMGKLYKLNKDGSASKVLQKALQKLAFEMVESKIIPLLPGPKMTPRYYSDIFLVNSTEALINHEIDRMVSEEIHDEAEHSCLIDGATWLKVEWDPFDNTNERSGMPKVVNCPIDTVFPQPGIADYKQLEYIFQIKTMTVTSIYDLYNRYVVPDGDSDVIKVIEVYYLNVNRVLGRLVYTENELIVLSHDDEWSMKKIRHCTKCRAIVNTSEQCPVCGGTHFTYISVNNENLEEDLHYVENKFRSGESSKPEDDTTKNENTKTIPKGTKLPTYLIKQLPFVPKRTIKLPGELYGISEVYLLLENQDSINKLFNKAESKSAKSKTYVTRTKDTTIKGEDDDDIVYINVDDAQQAQALKVVQVTSDMQNELNMIQMLYGSSKSAQGVTDTDQGKQDRTAVSGKAKEAQLEASAQRQSSSKIQRNNAYAGVYELIFKYLLAYSNEDRAFVATLPDGTYREESWSKYMFLAKNDKTKEYYYRDDFAWSVDSVAYITKDREMMWQLIDRDFLNGSTGSAIDPQRALLLYWHMKDQNGYPTAKFAIKFLEEAAKHLPTQIEQALMNNPEAVELALSYIQDLQAGSVANKQPSDGTGQPGGARNAAGKPNNGQTHNQQQEKTNAKQQVQTEVNKS